MTKKTLIKVVAIILVIASLGALFVGCKPKTDAKPIEFEDLQAKVMNGMEKSIGSNLLTDLSVTGGIDLETSVAGVKHTYSIDVAVQLELDTKKDTNKNGLKIVVKEDGKTQIGFWYKDNSADASWDGHDATAYMEYINPTDGQTYKLAITAPDVNRTLVSENAVVDGNKIKEDIDKADIGQYFGILGMLASNLKMTNDVASFDISLKSLLGEGGFLAGAIEPLEPTIAPIMKQLGIFTTLRQLVDKLPEIALSLSFNFSNDMVVGCDLGINIGKADFSVAHAQVVKFADRETATLTKKDGKDLLTVKLENETSIKLAVKNLAIANAKLDAKTFTAPFNYETEGVKKVSAGNLKLTGTFGLDKALAFKAEQLSALGIPENILSLINQVVTLNLNIPAGSYDYTIEADINPVALIGKSFNVTKFSPYYVAEDGKTIVPLYVNKNGQVILPEGKTSADIDTLGGVQWRMSQQTVKDIQSLAGGIIEAINYINIKFQNGVKAEEIGITTDKKIKLDFFGIKATGVITGQTLDGLINSALFSDTLIPMIAGGTPLQMNAFDAANVKDVTDATKLYTAKVLTAEEIEANAKVEFEKDGGALYNNIKAYMTKTQEAEYAKLTTFVKKVEYLKAIHAAKNSWDTMNGVGDALAGVSINISDKTGITGSMADYTIFNQWGSVVTLGVPSLEVVLGKNFKLNAQIKIAAAPDASNPPAAGNKIADIIGTDPITFTLGLKTLVYGGCEVPTV